MNESQENSRPSTVLRDEHQVILRVINILERLVGRAEAGQGFESDAFAQCVSFFQLFADACHHAKEEDLLFPVLESRGIPREGGPIGVMLYEHTVARGHVKEMGEALEGVSNDGQAAQERFCAEAHHYISLLRQHIQKEDNILFSMGDQMMTQDDQNKLCSQFCEVGCRAFGGKQKEELAAIADDLESKWGDA